MVNPLTLGMAAVVGACAGSFCATAAVRASRGEQALTGRSACDACGVHLGFVRTIPLLSYVQAGGACGQCGVRIDRFHLAGELGGAALVVLSFLVAEPGRAALLAALALLLLTAALIDLRKRRLPDLITGAAAALALWLSLLQGMEALAIGALSGAFTFALLQGVRWAYRQRAGEEGLGGGDVKLIAALSLWLGVSTPWAIALAAGAGLLGAAIVRPADGRLPFGPFVAAAALLVGFWHEAPL
jgi:leader peptidase (prepilin peptidase)/N-methyltransferase